MSTIVITACSFFILLGFEIRHRQTVEMLLELDNKLADFEKEIADLRNDLKLKKDAYEEIKPPR
jgi:hypothetical protein